MGSISIGRIVTFIPTEFSVSDRETVIKSLVNMSSICTYLTRYDNEPSRFVMLNNLMAHYLRIVYHHSDLKTVNGEGVRLVERAERLRGVRDVDGDTYLRALHQCHRSVLKLSGSFGRKDQNELLDINIEDVRTMDSIADSLILMAVSNGIALKLEIPGELNYH